MGGKSKQSQRTKNNARPSSSGRSADLLHNAVNVDPSAGGTKMMSALFPTLTAHHLEQGLSPEFSLVVKKLNKKDPITKVKALQELSELVNNTKVEAVVTVLPSWAHFYKLLTVDTDCKVREATQVCQGHIARVCGRQLATVLRAVLPPWLTGAHDEHAPAATAAHAALQATFPENKLPEVISFCKAEIVTYLMENLLGNTDKPNMKRAGSADPEELQQQLVRVTSGGLRALRCVSTTLPRAHDRWLLQALAPLLAAPAFWRHAAHAHHSLQAAWFSAMSALVERFGSQVMEQCGARLGHAILAAALQPPPLVAVHVWGCVLQLLQHENWQSCLDKKDLLIKRILSMLEKGGWGDAKRLADLLLPLLAHLPKEIRTKEFYESFFYALFTGLSTKSILNSKSERQYWITSLAECLRYLSIQQDDFIVEVCTTMHRVWLRTALFSELCPARDNLIKHSALSMASLLKYWLKQSKEPNGEKYDQLIRNFWQNVCSSLVYQVEKPSEDEIGPIIEGHILLLHSLKTGFSAEIKRTQSIKFQDDVPNEKASKAVETLEVDAALVDRYTHNLKEVVEKACCAYFEFADKNGISEAVLVPAITILTEFDSKDIYSALARHFGLGGEYELYEKVLSKWLRTDAMRCKAVVDVVFLLLRHLSDDEQDAVLESLEKVGGGVMEWALCLCASQASWRVGGARRWLRSPSVARALLTLSRLTPAPPPALALCLAADHNGDLLLPCEAAAAVGKELTQALCVWAVGERHALDAERVTAMATQLATVLASDDPPPEYGQLLQNLLRLLILVPLGDLRLSQASWTEARGALHDGAVALPPPRRARLRDRYVADLRQRLSDMTDKVDIVQIDHLTSLCPYLLKECNDPSPPRDVTEILGFIQQLFAEEKEQTGASAPVELFALRYDCIMNHLNCPFDDDNDIMKKIVEEADSDDPAELTKEILVPYLNKIVFRALCLKHLCVHKADVDDDDEPSKSWCEALLSDDHIRMEFCILMRDFVTLSSLDEAYAFWLHHDLIKSAKAKVEMVITDIISESPAEVRQKVQSSLVREAAARGYHWAGAWALYSSKAEAPEEKYVDKLDDIATGNGFFHCLQANSRYRGDSNQAWAASFVMAGRSLLAAFPHADQHLAPALLAARRPDRVDLDPIVNFYHKHYPIVLYERSISSIPWCEAVAEAAVLDCVLHTLQQTGWAAPATHWDFAAVTLCAVVGNLRAHRGPPTTKTALLGRAAGALLAWCRQYVARVPAECERRTPAAHIAALPAEWADVFGPALDADYLFVALNLIERGSLCVSSNYARMCASAALGLTLTKWSGIGRALRDGPLSLQLLFTTAAQALAQPLHACAHALAYRLLLALLDPVAAHDMEQLAAWCASGGAAGSDETDEGDEPGRRCALAVRWARPAFGQALATADAATHHLIAGVETCSIEPGTELHAALVGLLLLADALHLCTTRARGELTHHYIQAYKDGAYIETLLPVCLRLVPAWLLAATPRAHSHDVQDMFMAVPTYAPDEGGWRGSIPGLACRGVCVSVSGAGAGAARAWWAAARRAAAPLANIVRVYCGPPLVRDQLAGAAAAATADGDQESEMTVSVHGREARAVLELESRRVELSVRFPPEYPLALPAVALLAGPPPAAATGWIPLYIGYQNGSLGAALRLWAGGAGARAAAGAPCYICYCRLQPASGRLPDLLCRTCHNKFHRECIRKWFTTSHRNTCPLCRSVF